MAAACAYLAAAALVACIFGAFAFHLSAAETIALGFLALLAYCFASHLTPADDPSGDQS